MKDATLKQISLSAKLFHCDHGIHEKNKKARAEASGKDLRRYNISFLVTAKRWKEVRKELYNEIEGIRCAMCHDQHTGE